MVEEPGVRFALAHGALVVLVLLGLAVGLPHVALLVLAGVGTLGCGRGLGLAATAGLATSTWAVWTGFVEHDLGRLTLATGDLERLAALLVLAAALQSLGIGRRQYGVRGPH